MQLTANESIFCQALSMTKLLETLHANDFLNSEYFSKLQFKNDHSNHKKILQASGLGNPATLQMILYILLLMPKELLRVDDNTISSWASKMNEVVAGLAPKVTTYYAGEKTDDLNSINYYWHMRNAIAHSRCKYHSQGGMDYITFIDIKNKNESCAITMKTEDVDKFIQVLKHQMMLYLNDRWSILSWEEIQKKYPDQWVGLADVEYEPDNSATIKSASVRYIGLSKDELLHMMLQEGIVSRYTTPDHLFQLGMAGVHG